ncbi:MAG TPA: cytochrome P460 family protein [Planctomycetota bacterium]|nr:cytochrome P460 family protein [Planctomycetota bacterium]
MRPLASAGILLLASCSQGPAPEAKKPAPVSATEAVDQNTPLSRELLEIARRYVGYEKLIDWTHWSPTDCRAPIAELDRSRSGDDVTHGRKLYYLYARDHDAYNHGRVQPQPDGQVIVKEAWEPVEVRKGESYQIEFAESGKAHRYFKTGARSSLFIMLKLEGKWVYATVNGDGKTVTSSGQIESCLGCHRTAPHDSLFGDYMMSKEHLQQYR